MERGPYSVTSGRHLDIGELDFADNPYSIANGDSTFNSLQITVDKRVGFARFLGAYTFGNRWMTLPLIPSR